MNYWLRLYTGILNDPKVQRLAPEHFKGWVNLLCLAKENDGILPTIEDIAFRLRTSDAEASELIDTLKARGLLDDYGDGQITPHNWAGRQYETDAPPPPSEKGAVGNHVRWHVSRGILADDCIYCRPDVAPNRRSIASESPEHRGDSERNRQRFETDSERNRAEQSRAEADSETEAEADSEAAAEQRQSRAEAILPALPAAAAANDFNEGHLSVYSFADVEQFVIETKPHIRNPGGLARRLWRSGEEDAAIDRWLLQKAEPRRTQAGEYCAACSGTGWEIVTNETNQSRGARPCPNCRPGNGAA